MEGKEIIINIKITGDGAVDIKKLKKALSEFTQETEKNINVRKKNTQAIKGTEKAYLNEIKRIKQERAETARNSKQYSSYTKQLMAVENQLRDLTQARRDDIQVNANMISNQGLASNTITEFGRLISDAPFGIIAVTNNISQLGSQLGTLSRKTGSAKASFDILIRQLKQGGALILAFQVLISLVTVFGDKILDFVRGTNEASEAAKEFKESIKSANQELRAEEARLLSLVRVLDDSTSSREAQNNAAKELAAVLPGLNEEEIANKDNVEATRQAIEKYIEQQLIRAEVDALVEKNREAFRLKALIDEIDPSDSKAVDKFLRDNVSLFRRFIEGTTVGFTNPLRRERDKLFQDIVSETISQTEEATSKLVELQKQLETEVKGETGDGGNNIIEGSVKALQNQISALKKLRDETSTTVDEYTKFTLQIEKLQDELKELQGIMDRPQVESVSAFIAAEDTKLTKFLETELAKRESSERTNAILAKGEQDRLLAQEKLADMIVQQAGKFGQIQDQAFQSQIKRLDTERDIILNNDNLTAEEKDRLLKENDKQSRKIRIRQIKFERDMHMIEMSMELAKFALEGKTLLAGIAGDAAKNTADATGSIGKFLSQLGPVAGPIAYVAMIGGVIAQIVTARRKAEQEIKALSGPLAGVSSSGGGSTSVSAPAFNVVGATQTSQLAQTISQAEQQPIKAFVVASDVSTAQELERSTIEGASIG
jgi:hypothetical protein